MVGRPNRHRVKDILSGGSLLDRLVRETGEVDVHIIRQEVPRAYRPSVFQNFRFHTGPTQYWNTLWFFLGVGFISGMLESSIGYRAIGF